MVKPSLTKQGLDSCLAFPTVAPIREGKLRRDFIGFNQQAVRKIELRICAGRRNENARKVSPQKKKPRDYDKSKLPVTLELPSPVHSSETLIEEDVQLKWDQAIGRIVSAKANFMQVVVLKAGSRFFPAELSMENQATCSNGNKPLVENSHIDADDMSPSSVEFSDGKEKVGRKLLCVVRALLKKIKRRVMVGDKVIVSGIDWIDGRGMIEQIFDRKTEINDPPVANVDQLLVLAALGQPRPEAISLSRFLVEAESSGIPFTVVFNKTDLGTSKDIFDWKSRLNSWGYQPLFCSAALRSGISSLVGLLSNKTSAIVGLSGVGKSSLINALCDEAGLKLWYHTYEEEPMATVNNDMSWRAVFAEQAVGEVSERTGRGKHTTRHVSLLKLPSGGYLADTPGFNQPNLAKVSTISLSYLFPEIQNKVNEASCAFADCLHTGEPGCLVGGDWDRYGHYIQLLEEVKKREQLEMKTFGTKRESEMRYKVGASGVKQAEPLLVLKKHRRISRNTGKQDLASELAEEVDGVPLENE